MTTTLPPDVADLLRAISDSLAPSGKIDSDGAAVVHGAVAAVLGGAAPHHATWTLRKYLADPAAFWAPTAKPSTVCDTCHSEPVTVIDGSRRQCSTCALRVCDCCQVRRATTTVGCVEMCPLCAERSEAEVAGWVS